MSTGTHCPDWAHWPGSDTAAVCAAVPEPKTMPPAAGRTNVCTVSLIESSAGTLSAMTSTTSSTATMVSTQPFSSHDQPCGRLTISVNRANTPSISIGM